MHWGANTRKELLPLGRMHWGVSLGGIPQNWSDPEGGPGTLQFLGPGMTPLQPGLGGGAEGSCWSCWSQAGPWAGTEAERALVLQLAAPRAGTARTVLGGEPFALPLQRAQQGSFTELLVLNTKFPSLSCSCCGKARPFFPSPILFCC